MTFNDICWSQHSFSLNNMIETKKQHVIRFIHHRLPTGKVQFGLKIPCIHCNIPFDQDSDHDHFLICKNSEDKKFKRIKKIELVMLQLHTRAPITYHNTIRVSKSVNNKKYFRLQKITKLSNVSFYRTTLDGSISSEVV